MPYKKCISLFFCLLLTSHAFLAEQAIDLPSLLPLPVPLEEPLHDISYYLAKGLQDGIAGGVAGGLKEGIPATINAGAEAFKNQFATTGDGHQAVSNIFKSLKHQFEADGEGRYALRTFLNSVGDEFADNSVGRRMALNTADTTSAYIKKVGTTTGSVITNIVIKNSLITVLSALGIATVWYGSKVLWHYIERQLQKPKIIITSSRKNFFQRIKALFSGRNKKEVHPPMIFERSLHDRLQSLIITTKNIHTKIKQGKKNIKFRNILLYGPPGTGKTLFAQQLAEQSGMEFALTSGASFSKKGALEAMDDLFAWANKSNGLILFIDEAESLMPNRADLNPDSDSYRVFTSFLNYTGTRSNKYMIVMATNRLDIIDDAMHRRIDDLIEFSLPEYAERVSVLRAYRDLIIFDSAQNSNEFICSAQDILTDAQIEHIAMHTQGFSNGDLEGIINIIKTDADSTADGLITKELTDKAVDQMIQKHNTFNKKEEIITIELEKVVTMQDWLAQTKKLIEQFFDWLLSSARKFFFR